MEESGKEIKSLLVKEKGEKAGLKLSIQKMNFMAFGPVTSWQIYEGNVDIMTDFIFLGSKITSNSDCSLEIKRHLLLGREGMTNWDRKLRCRDIILLTKACIVKATDFPVVMYGCESWTIKKAES